MQLYILDFILNIRRGVVKKVVERKKNINRGNIRTFGTPLLPYSKSIIIRIIFIIYSINIIGNINNIGLIRIKRDSGLLNPEF